MSDHNLLDFFAGDPNVVVARHAELRDRRKPSVSDFRWIESYAVALRALADVARYPAALIREDGRILLLSAGGSGLVWVCTNDGEIKDVQRVAFDRLLFVFNQLGATSHISYPMISALSPAVDKFI